MNVAATNADSSSRKWQLRLPERLPDLKGSWLTIYTIIWAIMLPVSLIGAAGGMRLVATVPPIWTPYGIATTDDGQGIHVDSVASAAARQAGLKAGDYVVAVDGWQVPATASRGQADGHVFKPDGSATVFTVQRPGGNQFDVRLTRSMAVHEQIYRDAGISWDGARFIVVATALIINFPFIAAAIFLFVRRRREMVPALLSLSFLMIIGGLNPYVWARMGVGVAVTGIINDFAWFLLMVALLAFPSGRFEPRWTAVPFTLLVAIQFLTLPFPPPPPLIGATMFGTFLLLILAALVSRYRRLAPGAERQQLRWVFLGFVAGVVLLMAGILARTTAEAQQATDPRWLAWDYAFIGPLFFLGMTAMALGLIVSILRFRLYDADAVIGRSAGYGLLTLGFIALFAASQKAIELLGQEYLGQNLGGLAGGIGAALAAVAVAPMHAKVQRWAERRFQKALFRLRYGLPPLVGDLRETAGLDQIAGSTLDSVVQGIRASRAALLVDGQLIDAREIERDEVSHWCRTWEPSRHDGIDWQSSDPLFPVRVPLEAEGHGRVGWLLLGPRPDGSLFGKAERDAIEEVAEPVARAIQVAARREERDANLESRLSRLEALVQKLSAAPARPKPARA